jgi:hypothetical protein
MQKRTGTVFMVDHLHPGQLADSLLDPDLSAGLDIDHDERFGHSVSFFRGL